MEAPPGRGPVPPSLKALEASPEVLAEALAYPVTTPDASSDVPALPLEDSTAQPAAVGLQQ